jgi:hypothetical protein
MKLLILIVYFAFFGFGWPVFLTHRMRGRIMLVAMVAPWIAFWAGWFAR